MSLFKQVFSISHARNSRKYPQEIAMPPSLKRPSISSQHSLTQNLFPLCPTLCHTDLILPPERSVLEVTRSCSKAILIHAMTGVGSRGKCAITDTVMR